jgi:tyrosinase
MCPPARGSSRSSQNVMATNPENAEFRVFLDAKNPTPDTPVTDPHYVGSFSIFAHKMAGGTHKMPSFSIDLTEAVHRVGNGGELNVQVVPVPIRKRESAGTVTVEKVQIAFLTP